MENKAPKLSFREKLGYGLGTASLNLIFNIVSTYLLFFYTNVYGLKPADAATMFLVVRIIDAVASPIYGPGLISELPNMASTKATFSTFPYHMLFFQSCVS